MAFPMLDPSFMDMLATPPVDPLSLLVQPSVLGVPFDENDLWQYNLASLEWDGLSAATIIDDDEWCPMAAMQIMNYEPTLPLDTTASHDDTETIEQVEEESEDEDYMNWHSHDDDGSDYSPSDDDEPLSVADEGEKQDIVVSPDDDDSILDDDYHVPFLFKDGRSYAQEIVDIS